MSCQGRLLHPHAPSLRGRPWLDGDVDRGSPLSRSVLPARRISTGTPCRRPRVCRAEVFAAPRVFPSGRLSRVFPREGASLASDTGRLPSRTSRLQCRPRPAFVCPGARADGPHAKAPAAVRSAPLLVFARGPASARAPALLLVAMGGIDSGLLGQKRRKRTTARLVPQADRGKALGGAA